MKILYVSFDEVPSFKGASTHILSGLRIPALNHAITLLTLGTISLPRQKNFIHIPINIQEKNYLRRAILFQEKVKDILAQYHFDIVHFRGPFEGLAAVQSGIKCIYEVNALPSIELPYHYSSLTESVLQKISEWEKICLNYAEKIICPSLRIKSLVSEVSPELDTKKITVLPNGYDIPHYELPIFNNHELRRGVYIGTLSPWQGILWSLKAFRDLGNRYTLDLFTPYNKIYWKRALRRIQRYSLEDTVFLNPPLHKGEFSTKLSKYDFAIAPLLKTERNTRQGCCPLKIIDYLAHGLPTVASDLFVVKEIIKDPDYPYFFHPGSVLSLKAAIQKLSLSPCSKDYIRSLLNAHPTWDVYGEKLCRLYGELQSGRDMLPPVGTRSCAS